MHESDDVHGEVLLGAIRRTNEHIDELLLLSGSEKESTADVLGVFVDQRGDLFDQLEQWCTTDEARSYIAINSEGWREQIRTLEQADQQRLEVLKSKVQLSADQLRKTVQNKSVLLYQKEYHA